MITQNPIATYNDPEGHHVTIRYDSARIEIFHDFKCEKNKFSEAYSLYEKVSMCDSPSAAYNLLWDVDLEIKMYIPVLELFHKDKEFNYSPLLFILSDNIGYFRWNSLEVSNPVIKIVSEKKSLRGEIVESNLVDLIEMVSESDSELASYINNKLSVSFQYMDSDLRSRLVQSIFGKAYPKAKAAVVTSSRDENSRLLRGQRESMRDWLRAGNRW